MLLQQQRNPSMTLASLSHIILSPSPIASSSLPPSPMCYLQSSIVFNKYILDLQCKQQNRQMGFLARYATGMSVSIGSTFDPVLCRAGANINSPSPHPLSFVPSNGQHKGKELTLTVLEVIMRTHAQNTQGCQYQGSALSNQPKTKKKLSSGCSSLDEEHKRREDSGGRRRRKTKHRANQLARVKQRAICKSPGLHPTL